MDPRDIFWTLDCVEIGNKRNCDPVITTDVVIAAQHDTRFSRSTPAKDQGVWAQTPDRYTAEWPVAVKNPSFLYGSSVRSVAEAPAFSPNAPNRTANTAKVRPIDEVQRRMRITGLQIETRASQQEIA
jgi:hypothetical protein